LRDGIELIPLIPDRSGACHKRKMTQIFQMMEPFAERTTTFSDCHHNTAIAAAERHYCPVPKCTAYGRQLLEKAFVYLKRICRKQGIYPGSVETWTSDKVVSTRVASRKKVYAAAFASLRDERVVRKDFYLKAFTKFEKNPKDNIESKVPRLIQYRSPRALASLSTYFAPLEHVFYHLRFNGKSVFAKHMDAFARGKAIHELSGFGRVLLGFDHSRFDSHIVGPLLELEHRFYRWVFRGDKQLQTMLDWMKIHHITIGGSYRFIAHGGRTSGDYNTSLGNNIVNILVMFAWAIHHNCLDSMGLLLDGDDSVVSLLDETDAHKDLSVFTQLGMTTKLEERGLQPERVQFCQARAVWSGTEWRMMRDFRRVLTRLPWTIRTYDRDAWRKYARGVAQGEAATNSGTPILHVLANTLLQQLGAGKVIAEPEYERVKMPKFSVVTSATRISYGLAWNISPSDQESLESSIAAMNWVEPLTDLCDYA